MGYQPVGNHPHGLHRPPPVGFTKPIQRMPLDRFASCDPHSISRPDTPTAQTVKPGTRILHSRADDVVPFGDSVELVVNSRLPDSALIEVGRDHRLADPEPLEALLRAVEGH